MDNFQVGPAGRCPQCYRDPCICRETLEEKKTRETREERQKKIGKAHARIVELLKCEFCGEEAVVPDDVRREYICLACGKGQIPYSAKE